MPSKSTPKPASGKTEPQPAATTPVAKTDASGLDVSEPDVKEQFRLALERKLGRSGDAHGGGPAAGGKVGNTQGRAGNKREFRRKSGG